MGEHDYADLGLVAGLEIHQQLDTDSKLFCPCPTTLREPEEASHRFRRYLHPTRSELGELDQAAVEESRVDRRFEYLAYDTTCLVEADEEPPHRLDREALETALEVATLLEADPVDQLHVMRKIVVDGSNTAGFQRSALVATDGAVETDAGTVSIEDLLLEEESARRLAETDAGVRYSLDRLGIPLVEIGTGPDITTPEQALEVAEHIGMVLRSTGKVKRGLGTIRQDVNVSIEAGARVEIKGVQRLDAIDEIIRTEVGRQVELVAIAEALGDRDASVATPREVTGVFEDTESGLLRDALADGGAVQAVRLVGFDGLVGREIAPDRRLGTEFADHATRHGVGGIFHTDELPAYGIGADEVTALREAVGAAPADAVAFVAAEPETAALAIEAVADRAATAIDGVPEETRGALEDGTTRYLRPLPGAARMYPETDVPPVTPDPGSIEPPALLTERHRRYVDEYGLDEGLAEQVAFGRHVGLFERAVSSGVDPTLAATTLESTLTELSRDGVAVEAISDAALEEVLQLAAGDTVPAEAVPDLLAALADEPDRAPAALAESLGLEAVGEAEIRAVVETVIDRNERQVSEEGMAAFSGLMGECMAELRGRADGDAVSTALREAIQERT